MNDFFTTIRRFLAEYLPSQRCCSPNTIRSYRQALNLFVTYLRTARGLAITDISFSSIDRHVVMEFLDWLEHERGCAATTRNQRLMALRAFFSYAGFLDCAHLATSLALAAIPAKKTPGTIVEPLSEAALKALLQQPDTTTIAGRRNQVFMILMYDSAARCSELTGLRVRDLNLDTTRPTVHLHGKGNKIRIVPLLARTAEHCRQHLRRCHDTEPSDGAAFMFFTTIHGRRHPVSPDTVATFINTYAASASTVCPEMPQRAHPHMLRHTRAMHLYRQGLPLPLLADYLGHASIESTRIYAYADAEMKRAALEKADPLHNQTPRPQPVWQGDEDMILKLSGLT
jgi:site-specific recombinase XerD